MSESEDEVTLDTGPDPVVLREAAALRAFSNELVVLTGDYLDALYEHSGQPTAEFRGWLAQDFGPRFNDTRTRMSGVGLDSGLSAGHRNSIDTDRVQSHGRSNC